MSSAVFVAVLLIKLGLARELLKPSHCYLNTLSFIKCLLRPFSAVTSLLLSCSYCFSKDFQIYGESCYSVGQNHMVHEYLSYNLWRQVFVYYFCAIYIHFQLFIFFKFHLRRNFRLKIVSWLHIFLTCLSFSFFLCLLVSISLLMSSSGLAGIFTIFHMV